MRDFDEQQDAFEDFLQEEAAGPQVDFEDIEAAAAASPSDADYLRILAESSMRQEKLLSQMVEEITRLSVATQGVAERVDALGAAAAAGNDGGVSRGFAKHGAATVPKEIRGGDLLKPPGGGAAVITASPAILSAEDRQAQAERAAAERLRAEEEARKRNEALNRRRAEEEERKRLEAEAERVQEEKRREEERKRKEALQNKTSGLMDELLSGSGGGGLFEDTIKPKKASLFDE